nr:YigZ family protein [Clostridium sp. E02]
MRDTYRILYMGSSGEIIEKKSRFIASFRPVKTEEEAQEFIEEIRKKYWDARHHCYAWILGKKGDRKRCSDDGEPSQTAGKPMLDVLEGEEIVNVCVVVSRYFGGTLLGTGGLARAYKGAVKEGLKTCTALTLLPGKKLIIRTEYTDVGKIQHILGQQDLITLNSEYTDVVALTILVPDEIIDKILSDITEVTGAKADLQILEDLYYSKYEKEVCLFSK